LNCYKRNLHKLIFSVKEYTDSEIIECLRNRQSYVVHYLSDRYMPMIRLMVYQKGGTNEDARDIFQDGLIIMLEKLDNKQFALTCKFKTFLYCVCEHLWKTVLDKRQAASNYLSKRSEPEIEKDFTEMMDHRLYEEIFHEVFETLDPISKKILKLYWQEVSPQEIADNLGYTYGYVRKKKCEAQSELTEKVKKHPDYMRIKSTEMAAREVVH
jgi:RNA polymerase sigma factor (sigma-70 family)